jgi:pimeloyl-ACP methyl ester carboxylesterase
VPAARAGELLGRLSAAFDAMEAAMGAPMSGAAVEALVAAQVGMAERYGVAPGPLAEAARRNLVERDGGWWPRPDAKLTAELRVAMAEVDPYPAYRELGCPALVVLAGRDLPEQRPFGELTEAYRGLLRARYAELAAAVPTLSVVELPASHALLLEAPDRVAELVAAAVA